MKALYFDKHGELDVVKYGDVPDPKPGPGEVLIRVHACALNFLDIWVRRGWPGLKLAMPHWCGADVAGEIAELGENVSDWQVGQRVVVDPGVSLVEDEYTRSGEDSVSPGYHVLGEHRRGGRPSIWRAGQAPGAMLMILIIRSCGAPLLVGLTAWRMLIHQAGLRAGESVLVVGAGGGVNSMAIQMAKLALTVYVVAGNAEKSERRGNWGLMLCWIDPRSTGARRFINSPPDGGLMWWSITWAKPPLPKACRPSPGVGGSSLWAIPADRRPRSTFALYSANKSVCSAAPWAPIRIFAT